MSAVAADEFYFGDHLVRVAKHVVLDPDDIVCVKRHTTKEVLTYEGKPQSADTVERVFKVTIYMRSFPLEIEVGDLLPGVLDRWFTDEQE